MPRVTGPLMSLTASGKLSDAIVYTVWKGIAAVRSWTIPLNKKSEDQGDNRMIVGGLGRAAKVVNVDSDFHEFMKDGDLIDSKQSKQSALVKQLKDLYMDDATAFEAIYTAFNAHGAKTDFTDAATGLALADLDVDYKGTAHAFSKGMMLYVLARYGIDNSFAGSPYDTAIGSWTDTEIDELVADLAAPV